MNLGGTEILIVLFVALLLFGGRRLPELARTIGRGLAEFRRATQDVQREVSLTSRDLTNGFASPSKKDPPSAHDGTTARPESPSNAPRSDS